MPRSLRLHLVLLVAVGLGLTGCKVLILSGPATVAPGDTVVYLLDLSEIDLSFSFADEVVAQVPEGWQLVEATYEGTVNGEPVQGDLVDAASLVCEFTLGALPAGHRRFFLQADRRPSGNPSDVVRVRLELQVISQPSGPFDVLFVTGTDFACGTPSGITVNRRSPRIVELIQTLVASQAEGWRAPHQMAGSPEGANVYVAGAADRSIAVFTRDANGLSLLETATDGLGGVSGLAVPMGVAISPDGGHVYAASLSDLEAGRLGGLTTFARDPATGGLTFLERHLEDVEHVILSPDGRHLYAAADGVTVYRREAVSGALSFVETIFPGGPMLISPDGSHLYVSIANSLFLYERDAVSGALTLTESAPINATTATLSGDGRHLYALTGANLSVLERDPATGLLSFIESINDITGTGLRARPASVAISGDGRLVVVGGRLALSALRRNPETGLLTLLESQFVGNLPVLEWNRPRALAFVGRERHLFAAGLEEDTLLVFDTTRVFTDGFESGTVAAWSNQVP